MQLHSILKRFRFIYNRIIPIIFPCLWLIPWFRKNKSPKIHNRKILLIAQNNVAADHIKDIHAILKKKQNLDQFVTTDWYPPRNFDKNDICKIIDAKYVNIFFALLSWWDLIIFMNHPFGFGIWFAPFIKKIYINHGIHIGKINNEHGEDGVYGPTKTIRPFKKVFYNFMFTSSNYEMNNAMHANPLLTNKLYVAGSLRADNLLDFKKSKNNFRADIGLERNDKAVHIISTWGENSLFHLYGEELLDHCIKLKDKYKFMLSIHPRYDEFGDKKNITRDAILDKYKKSGFIVNRDLDWEKYIIASDYAIADHSSLSLYHLLLSHPVIYVDISQSEYTQESIFSYIAQHTVPLDNIAGLDKAIENHHLSCPPSTIQTVQKRILEYQGNAKARHLNKILEILYQ